MPLQCIRYTHGTAQRIAYVESRIGQSLKVIHYKVLLLPLYLSCSRRWLSEAHHRYMLLFMYDNQ